LPRGKRLPSNTTIGLLIDRSVTSIQHDSALKTECLYLPSGRKWAALPFLVLRKRHNVSGSGKAEQ
jgi:hypothetical protein